MQASAGIYMRHWIISIFSALLLVLSGKVNAMEVRELKLSNGVIQIKGENAEPFATISWEGNPVTIANKKGTFCFTTRVVPAPLPSDCLSDCLGAGTLSDGIDRVDVLVSFCDLATPSGPLTCRQTDYTAALSGAIVPTHPQVSVHLPRTTERPVRKCGDEPREIISSVKILKTSLAAISRGECSELPEG